MSSYGCFISKREEGIFALIGFIIVFLIFFSVFCGAFDVKKPTDKDYKPLYDQAKILEDDFSRIFFMDNAEYELNGEKMTVRLSDCDRKIQLELIFNKELNKVVESEKIDNYMSIRDIIFGSFEISMVCIIVTTIAIRFA